MIEFKFRTMVTWHGKPTHPRQAGRFKTDYSKSIRDLSNELRQIGATGVVVVEAGFAARDIRADGLPRSDARAPAHPGVSIFAGKTAKGPMRVSSDTYIDWQDNLRAIVLTLTALRAVARYGATRGDEQYKGFSALPPPRDDSGAFATIDEAAAWMASHDSVPASEIMGSVETLQAVYRRLVKSFHPDGLEPNGQNWTKLTEANELLRAHLTQEASK